MKNINWQRLSILKTVLDCESFSEAARQLGISQPTVSRQIKTLEQDLGQTLVLVTPDGVMATAAGQKLLPDLDEMARVAAKISQPQSTTQSTPTVRVACGPWLARFLCCHLQAITGEPVERYIEISSSVLFADIPRREADIAIRSKRPERGNMRVRRLPHYHYAVFGSKELVEGREEAFDERRFKAFNWAMMAQELDHFATSRWLTNRGVTTPLVRCSASVNLLDAVKSGATLAVIPCFAGLTDPSLVQVSKPFIPDTGRIWMVLPDDANRRPEIRQAADRIVDLFNTFFTGD